MPKDSARAIEEFRFRDTLSGLFMGTTSDRYAGWLGQIYTPGKYQGQITKRTRRLGGKVYIDEVLPVESVSEYFEHFPALELDFTFYRPLLDGSGNPTQNFHVLRTYSRFIEESDRVVLKVPQAVFARKVLRGGKFVANEDYLNPELFRNRFYLPAHQVLGERIKGFVFEQEYQRKADQSPPEELAAELEAFFETVPEDRRYHVEVRTSSYLTEPLFRVLKRAGVGLVLSHWSWLPPLRRQFEMARGADFNSAGDVFIRLLTPRGMSYEKTYTLAHPFDTMIDGMLHNGTVEETVEIIRGVVRRGSQLYLFINNRAGGNAPLIAQRIARELSAAAG